MRVEVLEVRDTGRRRHWTIAEKARIVEESLEPGAVAADVARRHEVSRSQIYDWRYRYRLGDFSEVAAPFTRIVPTVAADEPAALPAPAAAGGGEGDDPPEAPQFPHASAPDDVAGEAPVDPLLIEFSDGARVTVPVGYDVDMAARLILAMRGAR